MSEGRPSRRGSHVQMPVTYAAVGASRLPDIVRFPPNGATPYEETLRLGSGQPRFLTASSLLMTWAAQRGAEIAVEELDSAGTVGYTGPEFSADGTPVAPKEREEEFAPDGTPFITAGARARITLPGDRIREVLVIYTISEARQIGFAWGTADDAGPVGEQLFLVEHRDDDSVWAIGRGFLDVPKSGLFGRKGKQALQAALDAVSAQLKALLPGATPELNSETESPEPDSTPEAS